MSLTLYVRKYTQKSDPREVRHPEPTLIILVRSAQEGSHITTGAIRLYSNLYHQYIRISVERSRSQSIVADKHRVVADKIDGYLDSTYVLRTLVGY